MSKVYQVRLSGFGGQGIILAGIILGEAISLYEDRYAIQSQSYGPEARGGASRAEVVISDEEIDLLEVTEPHLLLALSQQAYNKYSKNLHKDGIIIIDEDHVDAGATEKSITALPISRIAREQAGNPIVTNMVALGVVAAITGIVGKDTLKKAVADRAPQGTEELNLRAVDLGYEAGCKTQRGANNSCTATIYLTKEMET